MTDKHDKPTVSILAYTGGVMKVPGWGNIVIDLSNLDASGGVTNLTATHDHKMLAASDSVVYLADGRITDIKDRDELNIKVGEIRQASLYSRT